MTIVAEGGEPDDLASQTTNRKGGEFSVTIVAAPGALDSVVKPPAKTSPAQDNKENYDHEIIGQLNEVVARVGRRLKHYRAGIDQENSRLKQSLDRMACDRSSLAEKVEALKRRLEIREEAIQQTAESLETRTQERDALQEQVSLLNRQLVDASQELKRLQEQLRGGREIHRTTVTVNGYPREQFEGLRVLMPIGLVPEGETVQYLIDLGVPCHERFIDNDCEIRDVQGGRAASAGDLGLFRIVLEPRPSVPSPRAIEWNPPASLPNGRYRYRACMLEFPDLLAVSDENLAMRYRDYQPPSHPGYWDVENGRAAWSAAE